MAIKTTTVFTPMTNGEAEQYPVYQATKIPAGVIVMANATGYAVNGADTASCVFLGISEEEQDNSSGASAALNIKVRRKGTFDTKLSGASLTSVGTKVYILYNDEVALAGTTTNDICSGTVSKYLGSGMVRVDMEQR